MILYSDINYDLCKEFTGTNNEQSPEIEQLFNILYSQKLRKDIQDLKIYVISTEDLIGRKMDKKEDRIPNDPNRPHPSAKAWDEIVPQLSKKFNL